MRFVATAILAGILSSCASRGPSQPPAAQTTVPTVARLFSVPKPDPEPVNRMVGRHAVEIVKVKSENDHLHATVKKAEQANEKLEGLLHRTLEEGQADKTRLEEIDRLAHEEKRINIELRERAEAQSLNIATLTTNAATLQVEAKRLNDQVVVANQRLEDTEGQLTTANSRITQLSSQKNTAVQNAQDWKTEADTAEGMITSERSWKWRFFWWGLVMTVLCGAYILLKMHPATRRFMP